MSTPERSVGEQRRVPAGSLEPMGGPNYAPPGGPRIAPPPAPRIPPPLLFGLLLVLFFGASGVLLLTSPPAADELTEEELGVLIREQEETVRTKAAAVAEQRAGSAVLQVETFPPGAEVTLDGTPAGRTPLRRDRLPSQWYVLSVRKAGHQPVDSLVYLDPGRRAFLSVTLTPSDLADTEVADAAPTAESPTAEPRTVARAEEPVRTPPSSAPPQPTAQPATPPRSQVGSIRVTSTPSGAPVRLDGRSVGTTPLSLADVAAGTHTVQLALEDHEPQSLQVEVEAGQRNTVQAALTPTAPAAPQTGSLSVLVRPWGSIYIDGALRARDTDLRYEVTLPVGEHRVRVEHPTLGAWERTVTVSPDEPTSLTAELSPRTP